MAKIVQGSGRLCSGPFCDASAIADVLVLVRGAWVRVWSGCAEHPGVVDIDGVPS